MSKHSRQRKTLNLTTRLGKTRRKKGERSGANKRGRVIRDAFQAERREHIAKVLERIKEGGRANDQQR